MSASALNDFSRRILSDRRSALRTPLSVPVMIESADSSQTARLHDLSEDGAMIETPIPLRTGEPVIVHCGILAVDGVIAWEKGNHAGVVFDSPLDEAQIVRQILRSSTAGHRHRAQIASD